MSEMQLHVENHALRRQIEELHAEIAQLRAERDQANARVIALLPQGTPEQLAELEAEMTNAVPFNLGELVAELEAERGA